MNVLLKNVELPSKYVHYPIASFLQSVYRPGTPHGKKEESKLQIKQLRVVKTSAAVLLAILKYKKLLRYFYSVPFPNHTLHLCNLSSAKNQRFCQTLKSFFHLQFGLILRI